MAAERLLLLLLLATPLSVVSERITQLEAEDTSLGALASVHGHVARPRRQRNWQLYDREGPKFSDVRQGSLGNCYFLAGLVALADTHPEIIEDAFVTKLEATTSHGVYLYELKFLLDGRETIVALDDRVPAHSHGFWFSKPNDGNDVWPILMEKAWAKLFGSYVATSSGWEHEPFKALTQAPVHTYRSVLWSSGKREWKSPDVLWKALTTAQKNNFPISAGSTTNDIGSVAGHAFAVIDVADWESVDLPKRVKVYNPWAANLYVGELHEGFGSETKGDYWLTFNEFQKVFESVSVAHVRPEYRISSTHIEVGKPTALRFTTYEDRPFAVQVEWPTDRFVRVHGCFSEPNHAKLLIAEEHGQAGFRSANSKETEGNLRVDMDGSGTYLVYVAVTYPGAPAVPNAIVNVYAHEDVRFEEITDKRALDVGRQILGLQCEFLVWPGLFYDDVYEALDFPVGGSPAWKKRGSTKLVWIGPSGDWERAPAMNRLNYYKPDFPFHKLECQHKRRKAKEEHKEKPEEEVPSGCGFSRGDHVELQAKGSEDRACGVVGFIAGGEVEVRYHAVKQEILHCHSSRLHRVEQCPWQPEDQVEFNDGGEWVPDEVVEVLCGKVKLKMKGAEIPCGQGMLRYPPGCPFYDGERVTIRDPSLDQWRFAEVVDVKGHHATVEYEGGWKLEVRCDKRDEIKKLTRCDKLIRDQISRLKTLDNYGDIQRTGVDATFPPELESIGPPDADCGDSADISLGYQRCDRFNHWQTISDVLGPL